MSRLPESTGPIFDAALELPKEQRPAFLQQACRGDLVLRQRVDELLCAHDVAEDFMEGPFPGAMPPDAECALGDQSGEKIKHYKLLQQIGEGGCGVVYMAEQEQPVRRRVALKIVKLGMDTRQVIARFEAERQALALMDHPNIAKVLDAGATEGGRPFFVMELVGGERITDYCDGRSLSMAERLALFTQVCRAVQHAHQKGVIHRDLKPSNILVTEQDSRAVPKVIDFGIAKATGDQRLTNKTLFTAFEQFVGTPAYMSPEQAGLGRLDIDTRSDIYSLGVLLYELITGQPPFGQDELPRCPLDKMLQAIREKEPPRPSTRLTRLTQEELTTAARNRRTAPPKLVHLIRGDLDWIVMTALEKDRARRYQTANGLAMDVERYLNSEPVVARPPSAAYHFQKLVRRNKLAFAAGGAVALALTLGVIGSTLEATRARHAEHEQAESAAVAQLARQQALAGARRVAATLTEADFAAANRLIEAHNGPDAVAYLLRILAAEPDNRAALTRLATLLTYHSWMVPSLALKHQDWVVSAEFSPDGKRILTGSYDHTAGLWDAQTGGLLSESPRQDGEVRSARFSPEGQRIVIASGRSSQVWDAQTWQPLTKPLEHPEVVHYAEFSPDGNRLVTACADNTARIWDAQTAQPLLQPLKHQGAVTFANFSPLGKRIVTASEDNRAQVRDAQTGQPLCPLITHEGRVNCAQFCPDGDRVVTASRDGIARVWDAGSGQPQRYLQHRCEVYSAQFSPDGRRILTSAADYNARVWDAQTGEPLFEPLQHHGAVWTAQFSPDGRRIVSGSADNAAHVWDVQTEPPLNEPLNHANEVVSAQFSPDGRRVVTASYDSTAKQWDAQTSQPLAGPLRHQSPVLWAEFSPDGSRIVTAALDQIARVWDAQTGHVLSQTPELPGRLTSAHFSPDSQRIVTVSQDSARIWDAQTGRPLTAPLKHDGRCVTSAQFSPDGRRLLTTGWDWTGRIWDAQNGRRLTQPLKHQEAVPCAHFSPDGRRVVTASADKTARVWDAQTGQALTAPLNHTDYVLDVRFSPDGKLVATTCRDGTARIWDAQTGQPMTELLRHQSSVECVQFSPDSSQVVTASDDGTVRVWDARTGQPLAEPFKHKDHVYSARFSADGKRILTASRDGTARLWDIGLAPPSCPDWLFKLAEALSGKRLNTNGVLESTPIDRAARVVQVRQDLQKLPDAGEGVSWGRWLLADRSTRTVSPLSSVTVSQYVENRITEATTNSLDEAVQLAWGNTGLSNRISEKRALLHRITALQREATQFANESLLGQSEDRYREAVSAGRQLWTNEPAKWGDCVKGQFDVLMREAKFDQAQQIFEEETPILFITDEKSAQMLLGLAQSLGRHGRWRAAAADISTLLAFFPAESELCHLLASLLAQGGDLEDYRLLCVRTLARFSQTDDPVVAARTARACLILPDRGIDLELVARLADLAVTRSQSDPALPWFELVKGQAEYRQGRFASTVDWMQKVLAHRVQNVNVVAQADCVLAMAQFQSGHLAESRASLLQARELIETKLPKLESGDLGEGWNNWIIANALLKEAKELIERSTRASQ